MEQYTISKMAKLFGIHPNTIRVYEKQGLLPPSKKDENNYSLYDISQFDEIFINIIMLLVSSNRGIFKKISKEIVKSYNKFL